MPTATIDPMPRDLPDIDTFKRLAAARQRTEHGRVLIPMFRRLMSDALTPVLAYRRLVGPDPRMAPSFLLESVVGGDRVGRYSYLGSRPATQLIARGHDVTCIDTAHPQRSRRYRHEDPLSEVQQITTHWELAPVKGVPGFTGGWVGYAGYDTVRYVEGQKLPSPPRDDRGLPDIHMGLYRQIVAFDHAQKVVLAITHVLIDEHPSVDEAYQAGRRDLDELVWRIQTPRPPQPGPATGPGNATAELLVGLVDLESPTPTLPASNMGVGGFQRIVESAKRYIEAGDIFQVVLSQRFDLTTSTDPFDIYRALRMVNPSPYMFYLQIEGGMLVGSSPEILCRVQDNLVTSRPLAGTRPRGGPSDEDAALEAQLRADPKERAEHVMLVDLGRNDVGRVSKAGSVHLPQLMEVERYSHVMHLSSTVTGRLAEGRTCWDALRYTLPVGTVSGAPKVRAMQIIDELEPTRRGPYGGAVGHIDFAGNMDMAIALRTMVVTPGPDPTRWIVSIQAGAGIVADSIADAEHQETVNKAAAMAKAVDVAQNAFAPNPHPTG